MGTVNGSAPVQQLRDAVDNSDADLDVDVDLRTDGTGVTIRVRRESG